MYLTKLLGYFLEMAQGMIGAMAPMRKKKTRALKRGYQRNAATQMPIENLLVSLSLGELQSRTNYTPLRNMSAIVAWEEG